MGRSRRTPTTGDGPFVRAAYERADEVTRADDPASRRKAWTRVVASVVTALVEFVLRDVMLWGAVVCSIGVAVLGLTSGMPLWAVTGAVAGVAGVVLAFVAVRRWSFGRQWSVYLGVVLVQAALMIALWQSQ